MVRPCPYLWKWILTDHYRRNVLFTLQTYRNGHGWIILNFLICVMVRPCPYLGEWTWTDHYKKKVIFSFHTIRNGHGWIFSDFQKGVMVCPCPYPGNGHGQIITEGR